MQKRFILLIDFSPYSKNLISYAYDWSKEAGAEMLLLHQNAVVMPALTDGDTKQEIILNANQNALERLKELAFDLLPSNRKIHCHVTELPLRYVLPDLLLQPYENLIFVGLKGTGLLKQIFLGSTALEIIKNAKSTVVAMPLGIERFLHDKIFIAINPKKPLNIEALQNFLKLMNTENTTLTFFYLARPDENTSSIQKKLNKLKTQFSENFQTNYAVYEGQHRVEDLKKVINNQIDELLVVQSGSRYLTDQIFRRIVINELVYEGQTPLVVLP